MYTPPNKYSMIYLILEFCVVLQIKFGHLDKVCTDKVWAWSQSKHVLSVSIEDRHQLR